MTHTTPNAATIRRTLRAAYATATGHADAAEKEAAELNAAHPGHPTAKAAAGHARAARAHAEYLHSMAGLADELDARQGYDRHRLHELHQEHTTTARNAAHAAQCVTAARVTLETVRPDLITPARAAQLITDLDTAADRDGSTRLEITCTDGTRRRVYRLKDRQTYRMTPAATISTQWDEDHTRESAAARMVGGIFDALTDANPTRDHYANAHSLHTDPTATPEAPTMTDAPHPYKITRRTDAREILRGVPYLDTLTAPTAEGDRVQFQAVRDEQGREAFQVTQPGQPAAVMGEDSAAFVLYAHRAPWNAHIMANLTAYRPPAACMHLDAGHDTNGNPRRLYRFTWTDGKQPEAVTYEEGYEGRAAVPITYRSYTADAPTIKTTAAEYRAHLKADRDYFKAASPLTRRSYGK